MITSSHFAHDALTSCIFLMNCAVKRPTHKTQMFEECQFVTQNNRTTNGWACRDRAGNIRDLSKKEIHQFFAETQSKKQVGEKEKKLIPGLRKEEIEWVVLSNLGQVRLCYENARPFGVKPGRIKTYFSIERTGNVAEFEVLEDNIGSRLLTNCVKDAIKKWQFPEPRGEKSIAVAYPFIFSS